MEQPNDNNVQEYRDPTLLPLSTEIAFQSVTGHSADQRPILVDSAAVEQNSQNGLIRWLDGVEAVREEFYGVYNSVDAILAESLDQLYNDLDTVDNIPFHINEDPVLAPFSEYTDLETSFNSFSPSALTNAFVVERHLPTQDSETELQDLLTMADIMDLDMIYSHDGGSPRASLSNDLVVDLIVQGLVEEDSQAVEEDSQAVEEDSQAVEADLEDDVPDEILEWVPQTANYSPLLVRILNYVYRQHCYLSKFRWGPIRLNNDVALSTPFCGPFVFQIDPLQTPGPDDPPPLPCTPEGLAMLEGRIWSILDHLAIVFCLKAAPRLLAFSPRPFKDFIYTSFIQMVYIGSQTRDSVLGRSPALSVPEKFIMSAQGILYYVGVLQNPPSILLNRFSSIFDQWWLRYFLYIGKVVYEILEANLLGSESRLKHEINNDTVHRYRVGFDELFPSYTGTFNGLLFQKVALSGPFNIRSGYFPLELRTGTSMGGDRTHGTLWGIGYEWLRCKTFNLPDPIWGLPFFQKIENGVDGISLKTRPEKEDFCHWEYKRVQEQDRADGRLERSYQYDAQRWESVEWIPIYNHEYSPRIAVL